MMMKKYNTDKKVNKFNIHWQIVRMKAKKIKDVEKKLKYVYDFLEDHKNIHNYWRVYNWAKMSSYAFRDKNIKQLYHMFLINLHITKWTFEKIEEDSNQDFDAYSLEDKLALKKDLNSRKYNFFYNGAPKAHVNFMRMLDNHLEGRDAYEEI